MQHQTGWSHIPNQQVLPALPRHLAVFCGKDFLRVVRIVCIAIVRCRRCMVLDPSAVDQMELNRQQKHIGGRVINSCVVHFAVSREQGVHFGRGVAWKMANCKVHVRCDPQCCGVHLLRRAQP